MMWFFAMLIVLVMGGVAALAAGRGSPLSPAYDDRPDALVPKEGPLGAEDLRRVRFSLAFRGYRMAEVDALLDRLAHQLEQSSREAEESPVADAEEPDPAGQDQGDDAPAVREARGDGHEA